MSEIQLRRSPPIAFVCLLLAACGSPPTSDAGVDVGASRCSASADCDDGLHCNGAESCDPEAAGADARGCVAGSRPCGAGEVCDEATDRCSTCDTTADGDGDGIDSPACGGSDCDDADPGRFPGNVEVCDGDDEDCDDRTIGERDDDGDGEIAVACCNPDDGAGSPLCGTDCDDATLTRREMQPEYCDSVDNDCNGIPDDMTVEVAWYPDDDGDGFGAAGSVPTMSCSPIAGRSLAATDCDDDDPGVSRVGVETCDGRDQDCDGIVDDGLSGCDFDAGMRPDMDASACGSIGGACCAAGALPGDPDGDGCMGDAYGRGCSGGTCVACPASGGASGTCETRDLVAECSFFAGTVPAGCRNAGSGYAATCCPGALIDADSDGVHDWIDCDPTDASIGACFGGADAGPRLDAGPPGSDAGPPSSDAALSALDPYERCDPSLGCGGTGELECLMLWSHPLDPGVCAPSCGAACPAGTSGAAGTCVSALDRCLETCSTDGDCAAGSYCVDGASLLGGSGRVCIPRRAVRACAVPLSSTGGSALDFDGSGGCTLGPSSTYSPLVFSYESYPTIYPGFLSRIVSMSPRVPGSGAVPAGVPVAVRVEHGGSVYDLVVRFDGVRTSYTVTITAFSQCDTAGAPQPYYADADGDGAGSGASVGAVACGPPPGHAPRNDDCDEFAADNSPTFAEICDTFDNDCSGNADEDAPSSMCPPRSRAVLSCSAGTCAVSACEAGYSSCEGAADPSGDGCEVQTGGTDVFQCGGCGVQCPGTCTGGVCAEVDSPFVELEGEPGVERACAIRASGEAACWGHTVAGVPVDVPMAVRGLSGVVELAVGEEHVCGRTESGRVLCWGNGLAAGAAPGSRFDTATEIPGITDAVEIAAARSATCVRRTTGQVLCWGYYALGRAGASPTHVPAAVAGLTDATSLDVTGENACAARAGGGVVCWGANSEGQVGDGTSTPRETPRTVTGVTGAARVYVGARSACAVLTDGSARCWGNDETGQLGDGTCSSGPRSAVAVIGLTGARQIFPDVDSRGCADTTTGRVYCWGGTSAASCPTPSTASEDTSLGIVAETIASGYGTLCTRGGGIVRCSASGAPIAGDGPRGDGVIRSGPSNYCVVGLDACRVAEEVCFRWSPPALSCAAPTIVTEGADAPGGFGAVSTFRTTPARVQGALGTTSDRDCYGLSLGAGSSVRGHLIACDPEAGPFTRFVYLVDASGEISSSPCRLPVDATTSGLAAGSYAICVDRGPFGGGATGAYELVLAGSAP